MEKNKKDMPKDIGDIQGEQAQASQENAVADEVSNPKSIEAEKAVSEEEQPLNEEELLMIKKSVREDRKKRRRLTHYDNSDKAKITRFFKRNVLVSTICLVLVVVMLAFSTVGTILFVKWINGRENKSDFTFILGDGKYTEKTTYTAKYEDVMRNGIMYIDMYKVAEYADLTVTGTKTSVKFTSNKSNYLRFENASNEAVINGSRVEIGGGAVTVVNADVCYVPYDFLTKSIGDSVRFSVDRETNTVKIERKVFATQDKNVYEPLEILFYTDNFNVLVGIQRVDGDYNYTYPLTHEPYLSAIAPENADEYLLLANKQTPLGESYKPTDLKELQCETAGDNTMWLREDAADSLDFMMKCMRADGITNTYVTSAYRSYAYQVTLWDRYVSQHMAEGMTREEAEAKALTYSARPGTSEHQTGLCIDFMTNSMTDLDESFENTQAFDWLQENAYKYGFILRYPSDKVGTTGYKYEPWHYRFVGREVATEIHLSNLCLEEYLELN